MITLQYLYMCSQDTQNAKHDNSSVPIHVFFKILRMLNMITLQYQYMYSQDTQNPKHDISSIAIHAFSRYSES